MKLADPSRTQSVARSFWRVRRKKVADPDVDMFIAIVAGLGADRLGEALEKGADPNLTDTEVLARHEPLLAEMQSAPWALRRRNAKAATLRGVRRFVRGGHFAYSPLAAFLAVGALGIWVSPSDYVGLLLWGVLVAVPVATVLVAWRRRARFAEWAVVGGGSSLAGFTAAYLLSIWLDDQSILRTGAAPIEQIGEAALLSLTIGVTGGTIGVDLNGLARVIAFLQILFLLSFAVVVVAQVWRMLAALPGAAKDD